MSKYYYVGMKNYTYKDFGDVVVEKTIDDIDKIISLKNVVEEEYNPYVVLDTTKKKYKPFPMLCELKNSTLVDLITGKEIDSYGNKNFSRFYSLKEIKSSTVATYLKQLSKKDITRYMNAINKLENKLNIEFPIFFEDEQELNAEVYIKRFKVDINTCK